jgi:hypothetical protein
MTNLIYHAVDETDRVREGLEPLPQPWEDGQRTGGGPGTFEGWTFEAQLDDGSTAAIVFQTKSLFAHSDPITPGVRITITAPDGTLYRQSAFFPAEAFQAASDTCDVTIGESCARGDLHRYEVRAQAGDLAADLVFTGSVPAWRPGAGKTFFNGGSSTYFGWLPVIPYGTVEGSLTYDGAAHAVHGAGYHDHKWGTVNLNLLLTHWVWGRAHVGDFSLLFIEMGTAGKWENLMKPVFLLAQGDRILTGNGRSLKMRYGKVQSHPGGQSYPSQLTFTWREGGDSVDLRLTRPQIIEATHPQVFLPPWKQQPGSLAGNPYYFRFASELGLEIHLAGVVTAQSGRATYELVRLH